MHSRNTTGGAIVGEREEGGKKGREREREREERRKLEEGRKGKGEKGGRGEKAGKMTWGKERRTKRRREEYGQCSCTETYYMSTHTVYLPHPHAPSHCCSAQTLNMTFACWKWSNGEGRGTRLCAPHHPHTTFHLTSSALLLDDRETLELHVLLLNRWYSGEWRFGVCDGVVGW